ncbi:putative bifunctional diguanylate cyclase/phosphodiesterase [Falsirhodobacter sp. 20TX0035]|uniref:putative bifunctional diguanylate cyclase/phosphodiesterase n=1 Tax=Falsirhodobacter sp. 20TX0035 TaxID=3022019 RepID=UPI00232BD7E4|nr:EAL domain-containing protein [Falsirhodobacter sp. 20TX0035]MDB6454917.1 EAL domain-containing protein [Falsirhodobacter sp. 20TX0035]
MTHRDPSFGTSRRSVSITLLAILFLGLAGVIVAGSFSFMGVRKVDRDTAEREVAFARIALASLLQAQPKDQQSSAIWNDAVLRVREEDEDFMEGNLGVWMQEFFGHDRDFVLRPNGTPVYASAALATVPVDAQAEVYPAIAPLVARLREQVLEAESAEDAAALTALDVVTLADGPALASVVPIVPENEDIPFDPADTYLHVALRHLDVGLAEKIFRPYQLSAPHFETAPAPAPEQSIRVLDPSAQPLWMVWTPNRPGLILAREIAPAAMMATLVCLMILLLLGLRLNRTTRDLEHSEAQARHSAHHDRLTGLANRVLLEERLEQALKRARSGDTGLGVIMVDLDAFKQVNDAYGHPMGDKLVQQVGGRLARIVWDGPTVARVGGDEFVILLPGLAGEEDLAQHCRWVQDGLSDPFRIDGHFFQVTASLGAVHSDVCSPYKDEVIRCADIALYRAKNAGRAQFSLYHGEMDDTNRKRNRLAADLAAVLTEGNGSIAVHYQPIFDANGHLAGAEALARWHHPELGPVPPDVFVAVAEERGLIEPLGRAVLDEACRVAALAGLSKVAVNVSALEICRAGYAAQVLQVLQQRGLPPSRLELELTERVAIASSAAAQANIGPLLAAGVTLALDDFGAGHSSIRYLRDFGFDRVKIDRSFVQQIETDPTALKLVRAMIDMASSLGIAVTAEGIEEEAQLSRLASLGCSSFQGYFLGRPMDRDAITRLAAEAEQADNVTWLPQASRSIA